MRTIMARTPHDSSFSFSKRHLQWSTKKAGAGGDAHKTQEGKEDGERQAEQTLAFPRSSSTGSSTEEVVAAAAAPKKKAPGAAVAVSRFRAAFMAAIAGGRLRRPAYMTGTLFGRRRGHVHFAFQVDPKSSPVLLLELATQTSGLVREMASGLVRIALECEKKTHMEGKKRLLEEPLWRTYCNGRKCGYAVRRDCGPADWRVLRTVEPVSMGAGVLPAAAADGEDDCSGGVAAEGEMMYMRARFERVVGSRDSEAFYMMSPDVNGGPELSIYLLRV